MVKKSSDNLNLELSTQFYQEGVIETDAWFQVAGRDYAELIRSFDFVKLFSLYPSPIELLDVGCGTGKFPKMILPYLPSGIQVLYDYLDPSRHSLNELRAKLTPPYWPRRALNTSLEELRRSECPANGYHIIWCMQSLYCVQHESLALALQKLRNLINTNDGMVMIFLASREAFYHRLYNLYNGQFYPGKRNSYVTAEDVTAALDSLNIHHGVKSLEFHHTILTSEKWVLENYLKQCVLDDKAHDNSLKSDAMNIFLKSFQEGTAYKFPQTVWLIMFGLTPQKTNQFMDELCVKR